MLVVCIIHYIDAPLPMFEFTGLDWTTDLTRLCHGFREPNPVAREPLRASRT